MKKFIQFEQEPTGKSEPYLQNEGFEDYCTAMQNAFTAFGIMNRLHDVVKRCSNENYSLVEKTVLLTHDYSKQLVGDFSPNLSIGTEHFTPNKRKSIALEGIGDWLSKIWIAIKEFFKKIYNFLTGRNVESKTAEKVKAIAKEKASELAKSLMGDFLMEGDNPNDYSKRLQQTRSVLYKILDHMDYSLSRCEIYEKFLAGNTELKNLISELKRRETNQVGSSGFAVDATLKNEFTLNVVSHVIYTDAIVRLETPNFRTLTEDNFKDILKYYGKNNKNENLPGPEKEKLEKFRENLTFDVDDSKLNGFVEELNKEIELIKKDFLKISNEAKKFTKKISVIDLDDLLKNKTREEIFKELTTPDEEDEVEKLPGLLGVAGKGFMAEIRLFMQLEGIGDWFLNMVNLKTNNFNKKVAITNMTPVIVF